MEVKTEVKTFETQYICDKCKVGEMKYTGYKVATGVPRYIHICQNAECREKMEIPKVHYPIISYERVE